MKINFRDAHIKKCLKYKEYVFPSGRRVNIQGYEDLALDMLLKEYPEEKIIVTNAEIEKAIGRIYYKDGSKTRRYFPDIVIIGCDKKVFEVKSAWTYKLRERENLLKRDACLAAGLDFGFLIFDNRNGKF